ncbi:MAG: Hsp20/alpha crystallin family protein [Spirochaetes bacterium]|nr:Hsp20/alpha crystallin family protein [Spirochaetota bacterium]
MQEKIVVDLGRIMDEIFETAEKVGSAFHDRFDLNEIGERLKSKWDENTDYYPTYPYPPTNVFMKADKTLVFEFALAGFKEDQIQLAFKGDYMVLSAKVASEFLPEENIRYFKHRLKLKDIVEQKYYVPEDKFDRENVKAVFRHGILKVEIPPKESPADTQTIKIEIVKEE